MPDGVKKLCGKCSAPESRIPQCRVCNGSPAKVTAIHQAPAYEPPKQKAEPGKKIPMYRTVGQLGS